MRLEREAETSPLKETSESEEARRKRKKTVTRTIRMDSEVDQQLARKAEKERVSVNAVIVNALSTYVDWSQHREKARHATVSISLLQKMMDHLTASEAEQLGGWYGENAFTELVNSLFGRVRFTSILATLVLMARYSGLFDLEHTYENSKHHLRILHPPGTNWSIFFGKLIAVAFDKVHAGPVVVSSTDTMTELAVAEPQELSFVPGTAGRTRK